MQVIFIKNLKGVGREHDVKNVADGYALNFLLPKGYAIIANQQSLAKIEQEKENKMIREKQEHEDLEQLLDALKKIKSLTLGGNTHTKEKLYKAIHLQEIILALQKQHHLFVPKHLFHLNQPIKEMGEHAIMIGTKEKNISFFVNIIE
jgi:large subunit ribosomal protein L9